MSEVGKSYSSESFGMTADFIGGASDRAFREDTWALVSLRITIPLFPEGFDKDRMMGSNVNRGFHRLYIVLAVVRTADCLTVCSIQQSNIQTIQCW